MPPDRQSPPREVLLEVRINGMAVDAAEHILLLNAGRLAALPEAFERWRIRLPAVEPITHRGQKYFPLDAVLNLSYQIDKVAQALLLEGQPYVFLPAPVQSLPPARPAAEAVANPPAQAGLLRMRINGVATGSVEQILRLAAGRLAAPPEAFERWRIRLPAVEPIIHRGQTYFPLDAVLNLSYQVRPDAQELWLEGPPYVFLPVPASVVPVSTSPRVLPDAASLPGPVAPSSGMVASDSLPVRRAPEETASDSSAKEILLEVRINGMPTHTAEHILQLAAGRLAALPEAFERWRIRAPAITATFHQGEKYLLLDGVKGLTYRIDQATQELLLEGPAAVFSATAIAGTHGTVVHPAPPVPGGFFNYDFSSLGSTVDTKTSGLLELGGFNRLGVGTATFLWQDFGDRKGLTRLDTAWTQDHPDQMQRLRIGDTIGRAGAWGRAVRFGGMQWGTSFDTQPGFIPFPQPGVRGEAVLPSTLDVYVNNALRLRSDIPPGPFEISNLPVVTGQGQVQLVVRDMLGRQQIITQPYYASSVLLRQGLSDYAYELGFVRQNFGLADNDYGSALATATHRLGVTDRFTRELRAEILGDQQTLGVSGAYLWPTLGTGNASAAVSHGPAGDGGLFALGLDHQSSRVNFGIQGQIASSEFAQLGLPSGAARPRQTLIARAGYAAGRMGAFSLSYVRQSFWGQDQNELTSASYSVRLGQDYFLSVIALENRSSSTNYSIGLTLTRPLGARTSGSINSIRQAGGDSTTVQVQGNLPEGPGVGYRMLSQSGQNERAEVGGFMQTRVGTYRAEASQAQGLSSYRLGASGGIAFLGGVFPSRRIDNSFAVAKTGDYSGVRVYRDNQPVGRTDGQGRVMIPNLRAYELNSISIEQADLPLDAQVDALRLPVTPYLRSGVLAEFPVRASKGGVVTIVLEDGTYLPSGSVVRIAERPEEFPVAYRGEAYLTGLGETNELQVTWKEQECRIKVEVPPGAGLLPHLGTFVCKGVKP